MKNANFIIHFFVHFRIVNIILQVRSVSIVRLVIKGTRDVVHHTIVNRFLPFLHNVCTASSVFFISHSPKCCSSGCDPAGTHMERGGRCICKYNVEGDRCDQCKRSHFYLNPTTPNGCVPCFCSGVSTDCSSTDWRRQAVSEYIICCYLSITYIMNL